MLNVCKIKYKMFFFFGYKLNNYLKLTHTVLNIHKINDNFLLLNCTDVYVKQQQQQRLKIIK